MLKSEFDVLMEKVNNVSDTAKEVDNLGGITHKVVQSDKLGCDWKETYVGDKLIVQEYVEQEVKKGTEENPIVYSEDVPLINNAFYLKEDGKLYVYMDGNWADWEV